MPEKDAMLSLAKGEGEGGWLGGASGGRGYTEQLRLQTVLKTISAR